MFTEQFTNVDAAKWERIKAAVKAKVGITVSSDIGDAQAKGIELSWTYNAATLDLAVALLKRSWYDPSEGEIDTDLKAWVGGA
jgi:hypothetical protein